MTSLLKKNNKIIAQGKEIYEQTAEYRERISKLKMELNREYTKRLASETNWINKLLIRLQYQIDLSKKMQKISSYKNLHLTKQGRRLHLFT